MGLAAIAFPSVARESALRQGRLPILPDTGSPLEPTVRRRILGLA